MEGIPRKILRCKGKTIGLGDLETYQKMIGGRKNERSLSMDQLVVTVFEMAKDIHTGISSLVRQYETNKEWGSRLKAVVQASLSYHFTRLIENQQTNIYLLNMPYTAETGSGRGLGSNPITSQKFVPFKENEITEDGNIDFITEDGNIDFIDEQGLMGKEEKIYCLIDIVDGTWNASCGLTFSCSTMLAFTRPSVQKPTDLTLADFEYGFIIPYCGFGLYVGQLHNPTMLLSWDGLGMQLNMSPVKDVSKTRVILDLFTEEKKDSLAKSIPVIGPVIYDWCDYGRFYGAGVEIAALFGYRNLVPGFSAYVAAHQKMDNIVPSWPMILGAGGIVSDWWGDPITTKRLSDRVHIVMAANRDLHDNLVGHLSKRPRN